MYHLNVDISYKKFEWISGSGGCIRPRVLPSSVNLNIDLGVVSNSSNTNTTFLLLDNDHSQPLYLGSHGFTFRTNVTKGQGYPTWYLRTRA